MALTVQQLDDLAPVRVAGVNLHAGEGLEHHPRNAALHYDLGGLAARAGERATAIEHLRTALEVEPRVRAWAESDPDLDGLRSELSLVS